MNFVVPVPSETFDVVLEDGASIRVRRHGNRDGVRLTVTHGNGFASDAYLPFWQQLTPHYDVLVFDFRNHGQNVPVEPSNHNYAQLSRDLDRVRDAIDSRLGNLPPGPEAVVLADKSISFLVLQRVLQQALKTLKLNAATSDFSVINYEEAKFVIALKDGRKYTVTIAPVGE
jgi:hypothetical protein